MNRLSTEQRSHVISCLIEGCSIRSTVRLTGVAKKTVMRLLVEVGAVCSAYQDRVFRNLSTRRLQLDELWAFCYCKAKNVTPEIAEKNQAAGDVWLWVAIDADTKLVPSWFLGDRDAGAAVEFVQDVASRLAHRVQLTSDGLRVYLTTHQPALVIEAADRQLKRAGFTLGDLYSEITALSYRAFCLPHGTVSVEPVDLSKPRKQCNWLCLHESEIGTVGRARSVLRRCGLMPCVAGLNPLASA